MGYNIKFTVNPTGAVAFIHSAADNRTTIESGETITLRFTADGTYFTLLKAIDKALTVTNATVESWTCISPFKEGTLVISNPTGDVEITMNARVAVNPQSLTRPFKLEKAAPIDTRLMLSKYEMVNMKDTSMPECYFAICKDDQKLYIYSKNTTIISPETGKFSPLEESIGVNTEEVEAIINVLRQEIADANYVTEDNLDTKISAKLNGYYDKETTDQLLDELETKADDVSILYNDEGELTLNPVFLEYLQNATYKKPSIVAFTMSGLKSSYIVGETISSSSFTHYESEIGNIKGDITFSITGGYSETIKPISSNTTITLSTPYSKKFTSHGEEVIFTLKGTDVKGNSISKSTSKKAYYPFYHGVSSSTEITETLAKGLTTKIGLTSGSYTYSLSENAYIYWITTTAISSIKDSNGNVIDYVNLEDLTMPVVTGGDNVTYKVYRTSDKLVKGSWVFTVA